MQEITLFIPMGMEWVILVISLVVLLFGAKKIPELSRALGKSAGEFKRGKDESDAIEIEAEKEGTEEKKIQKAATELGIDITGKSKTQLKKEIRKATAS